MRSGSRSVVLARLPKERLAEELQIVVAPTVYDKLDRRELQAFLTSLKPS